VPPDTRWGKGTWHQVGKKEPGTGDGKRNLAPIGLLIMDFKIFRRLGFLVGLLIGFFLLNYFYFIRPLDLSEQFQTLWQMEFEKPWPDEFKKLRSVHVLETDAQARQWLGALPSEFRTIKDGNYQLNILATTWEEAPQLALVVQYDLIDLATGNTIFETGHTFILDKTQTGH
jgi:hypothetical protein